MYNPWISSSQCLQLAHCLWCRTENCPVQEYLLNQKDVLDVVDIRNTTHADSPPQTNARYRLKLETEDIGNKFIEVYKKSQQICEQCQKQYKKLRC